MSDSDESCVNSCDCCLHGFHIDVDFVRFAAEQLAPAEGHGRNSGTRISLSRKDTSSMECTEKSSYKALVSEKCKIFMNNKRTENDVNPKVKHVKRESALIQQKIVNLRTNTTKSNDELFGADLLQAFDDFDSFVTKTWGNGDKLETLSSRTSLQSFEFSKQSTAPKSQLVEKTDRPESELTCFQDGDNDNHDSKDALSRNNVCTLCKKLCSSKQQTSNIQLDQSTSKQICESSSKSVNTEFKSQFTCSTGTNTTAEEFTMTRSEQLSKLTIRTQPIKTSHEIDCGCEGEGHVSPSCPKESKCEMHLHKTDEEGGDSKLISPSEDMRTALDLVNRALVQGRTGRDVAAAMSVVLHEWFRTVRSKTAHANVVENYVNIFKSYSPQLLRYMVNLPDECGITALHYAVSYGNFSVVSKLLDTGVIDVNKANKAGYTSIMLASLVEISTAVESLVLQKLIELGNVNTRAAQHGQTALMLAAANGRFKMVQLLLQAGAEVNAKDEDGSTALMCAVEHGHADIVQCILAHPGCNPNMKDNDGMSALNVAMTAGHKDIAVLLYAHMNFYAKPASPESSEKNLLSKRSKSAMYSPYCPKTCSPSSEWKGDPSFLAKKQRSSIN